MSNPKKYMEQPTLFEARNTDPNTSRRAAERLSHKIGDKHRAIIEYLKLVGSATDDQIASAMVDRGLWARHEQARRAIRTLREHHRQMRAVLNDDGTVATAENVSGRQAILWEVT